MNYPLVSIISVNFNTLDVTLEFLASIFNIEYPNIEVIIVDNASAENPEFHIKSKYPQVTFIRSSVNLGFAGGNNLGIRIAKGKYLMFLNNDTEVSPTFLKPMVELFENNNKIGLCSPLILFYHTDNLIQYAGSTEINPYTGRNKSIHSMKKDLDQFNKPFETALAHGAAMMIPNQIVQQVGEMPELFFLYYEELDWCEIVKRAGYKIYVEPRSKVYHKESTSIGKKSTLKTYYLTRNRLLFMRRNTGGTRKFLWITFFTFFSIPKNSLVYLMHGELDHLKVFFKAILWNLAHKKNGHKLCKSESQL